MQQDSEFAFIFDMDGTLVDNMHIHNQVWMDYLAELGAKVDPNTFNDLTAGRTSPEIARIMLGDGIAEETIQFHCAEKESRYRETYRSLVAAMPGSIRFLEEAQQMGIALGLATSAGPENIRLVLDHSGLARFFPVIVNANDIKRGKPDPEIFLRTAELIGAEPRKCLVFEDSRGGIEAGRRAGMPVIAITTVLTESQVLEIPGVVQAAADYTGLVPADLIKQYLMH